MYSVCTACLHLLGETDLKVSLLLWLVLALCLASLVYISKQAKKKMFPFIGVLVIVRGIITLGVQPTLTILGLIQVQAA